MQLTNGALKKSLTPPPLASQLPVDELEGVDLETFDLSAFVVTGITKDKSAVATLNPEVESFIKESEALFKLGEKFEVEVVQRGHQSLYELLASIYGLALRIEENPQKDKILEGIRKDLKDNHDISVKSNSTPITVMVKYVIRADKVTASRYTKVLTVARDESVSVVDLPAYITRRGGVTQAQEAESVALAKKTGDKSSKERTVLIREFFKLMGETSKNNFQFAGDVIVHSPPTENDKESSSFCVFVAHHVSGDQYKMISANDLGKGWEDNLVKYLGKSMPSNLFLLERGIRNYKRTIAMDPTQPESLRKEMERQLAIPMKYKQTEVIEMDASIEDDAS
jgi:hypothetical protein